MLQKIKYPCGCELLGKAPLPADCPSHGPQCKNVTTSPSETLVSVVLDESGSMSIVRAKTIEAYNEYISGLKSSGDPFLVTLAKFDSIGIQSGSVCRIDYRNLPVADVPQLDEAHYGPRGNTPLYDAVGETITELDKDVRGRDVIMLIMTDGENNDSHTYSAEQVKGMITEREKRGWTFIYLGANQDAWRVGDTMGISANSTRSYSTANMGSTMRTMSASTVRYNRMYKQATPGMRAMMSSNYFDTVGVSDVDVDNKIDTNVTAADLTEAMGRIGGRKSADSLTPKQRTARARNAGLARGTKSPKNTAK